MEKLTLTEQDLLNMETRGSVAAEVTLDGQVFRELVRLALIGISIDDKADWNLDAPTTH